MISSNLLFFSLGSYCSCSISFSTCYFTFIIKPFFPCSKLKTSVATVFTEFLISFYISYTSFVSSISRKVSFNLFLYCLLISRFFRSSVLNLLIEVVFLCHFTDKRSLIFVLTIKLSDIALLPLIL